MLSDDEVIKNSYIYLLDELMEDILLYEVNILFYRDFCIRFNSITDRNILSVSSSIEELIHKRVNK